jgi:sensor domain CHASE-containing protein
MRQISALLWILAALLVSVVLYSAHTMNQTSIERQKALIDNALSLRLSQSLSELRSVAWWDEAVIKSRKQGFDPAWLDVEIGVFMTTSYAHSQTLIISDTDVPVYGFSRDTRLSKSEQQKCRCSPAAHQPNSWRT